MTNILRIHKLNTAELISLETQCNDSTFVDKLFKSVFKSFDLNNMLKFFLIIWSNRTQYWY